eukprot:CAMPEP_0118642724 /NCGR_PEP_ID=MMETSP0785-20121206/5987_1 /TAXON_ID=91992 /ORGANISM="Bolidomonas pacifica, Strain CCMP 1866" /LENGTH=335 /DNA_ID=CAMNT_0006534293 /DNA_START=83 /DNA_END=1086 /DNA_ORIENTATION=+
MTNPTAGVITALISPLLMTFGFIIWDKHWSGSAYSLNLFKCTLASMGFVILSIITRPSSPFSPSTFDYTTVGMLILSSFIGILIGDNTWLEALRLLGARRVIVVDTVKPVMASVMGSIFLDEHLNVWTWVGMFVTLVSVLMVSLEGENNESEIENEDGEDMELRDVEKVDIIVDATKKDDSSNLKNKSMAWGYVLAAINVLLDAYGSVLTKQYGGGMTTWEINLVRFGSAAVMMMVISTCMIVKDGRKQKSSTPPSSPWYMMPVMERITWYRISVGVLFVTFACPALKNYALFQIQLGLALTLGSTGPIYSLPLVSIMKKEKVSRMACFWTLCAV